MPETSEELAILESNVEDQRKLTALTVELADLRRRMKEVEARTTPEALDGSLWMTKAAPYVQSRALKLLRERRMETFDDFMVVMQAVLVDTYLKIIDQGTAAEIRSQLQMAWAAIAASDPEIAQRTAENNQSVYVQIAALIKQARDPVRDIEGSYTTLIEKVDDAMGGGRAPELAPVEPVSTADKARAALAEAQDLGNAGKSNLTAQGALDDDLDLDLDLDL